jgi:hypothetical protein
MIREEEVQACHPTWGRDEGFGHASFVAEKFTTTLGRPCRHQIEIFMTPETRVRRDGAEERGFARPWAALSIVTFNWGVMLDVSEAEAVRFIKSHADVAYEHFRKVFEEGEARLEALAGRKIVDGQDARL